MYKYKDGNLEWHGILFPSLFFHLYLLGFRAEIAPRDFASNDIRTAKSAHDASLERRKSRQGWAARAGHNITNDVKTKEKENERKI